MTVKYSVDAPRPVGPKRRARTTLAFVTGVAGLMSVASLWMGMLSVTLDDSCLALSVREPPRVDQSGEMIADADVRRFGLGWCAEWERPSDR